MAEQPTAAQLRKIVQERHQAVNKKISRTRRVNGTDIAGTQHDPRRNADAIKRYTRAQLQKTLESYDMFMSRTIQFYGDAERRPITRGQWQTYKRAERRYNKQAQSELDKIGSLKLPGKKVSLTEFRAANRSEFPRSADAAANDPYVQYDRKPSNMANVNKMLDLASSLKDRSRPERFSREAMKRRLEVHKMFETIGHEEFQLRIISLSPKQWDALWATNFANAVASKYELAANSVAGRKESFLDTATNNMFNDIERLIGWAEKVE
jgi:hypothetical protein